MPRGKQSIPIRAARTVVLLWLCILLMTFSAGIALAAVHEWRDHTASNEPTTQNTIRYVEHGRIYFTDPTIMHWRERLTEAFLVLAACTIAFSAVGGVIAWRTDAVGRRFRFR